MNAIAFFADVDDWGHMNGWGGGWMWISGIVMMSLFVGLVFWLIRTASAVTGTPEQRRKDPTGKAREILAERFAHGELTIEEYRERVGGLQ